jgi:glycosyltransferase involved in cell wall biosynthesis
MPVIILANVLELSSHPITTAQERAMREGGPYISVITPVYRSEESLVHLYERVTSALETEVSPNFELIMVNDHSPDSAWEKIKGLVDRDHRVRGIHLSRNFGQYYALTAGLDQARGEWVVIMDCDLQDLPEEIPKLNRKALEGFYIVLGQRVERQDSFFKRLTSRAFYKIFSYLTDTAQDPSTSQFGIYHRTVVGTLIEMRERLRFLPAFIQWVGFQATAIPVRHNPREFGATSYSFKKLLHLALDTIIGFSDKPLRLTVKLGFIIAVLSFLVAIVLAVRTGMGLENDVLGWPSLIISIWFLSGLMIFIMGFIGLFVSKIYDEVKQRPLYIVRESYEFL